jgi:hypothetical protein
MNILLAGDKDQFLPQIVELDASSKKYSKFLWLRYEEV